MDGHHHHDHHTIIGGRLRTALALTLLILWVEVVAGLLSHSLALLSDAGHVLTDALALGLAWFASAQAARPADARNTYGYHRTGILTAMVNAVLLIVIVLGIAYEAIRRLQQPEPVTPAYMFGAAALAIVVNLYVGLGLRRASGSNLNLRAATLHVFGDVAASVGVIVAGAILLLTGWYLVDPILSLAIALLIAKGAWDVLRETVDILMEATPRGLNVAQLVRDMLRHPAVRDVHDLHVWSIAGGMRVLSAHVQVGDDCRLSACDALQGELSALLRDRYDIGHTTIQFERAGCDPSPLYCSLHGADGHAHGHAAVEGAGEPALPTAGADSAPSADPGQATKHPS